MSESLLAARYRDALEKIATPIAEPQWCPCGGRFSVQDDAGDRRCDVCGGYLVNGLARIIARRALDV